MRPYPLPAGQFALPGNRWDLLAGHEPAEPPTVSVIVPYFQAQQRLDLVLTALSLQTYPADRIEVIVADDGSATAPDLSCAGRLTSRTVRQRDQGFRAAAARNLGARAATGSVLCFIDDDTICEPEYLRRLVRLPALTPDAVVVARRRHADFTGWTPDRLADWLTAEHRASSSARSGATDDPAELVEPDWLSDEYRRSRDLLELTPLCYRFVISAVLACSAALFAEVGGFDDTLIGYGGEDWDFTDRALTAGAVLAHVRAAVAWHDGPDWALRGTAESRRQQKNAETLALLRRIPPTGAARTEWAGPAELMVSLDVDGAEPAAVLVCLRWLLAARPDCTIVLTGDGAAELIAQQFAADPRIGQLAPSRPARYELQLSRPLRLGQGSWPQLARLAPDGDIGAFSVDTTDGSLHAVARRASTRARRWQRWLDLPDPVDTLFGRVELEAAMADVSPVPRQPDLGAELAALARAQP